MRIYLIGLPGVGKSTTGKALAEKLNYSFIDVDKEIERAEKVSISYLFNHDGEEYFRNLETRAIRDIKEDDIVISLGGGIVEREENLKHLKGLVIYLKANLDYIKSRTSTKNRPLLKTYSLEELYSKRHEKYILFSNMTVEVEKSSEEIADQIANLIFSGFKKLLVVSGPNLKNMDKRDPKVYGKQSYVGIIVRLRKEFRNIAFTFYQSNHEGAIIDKLEEYESFDGLLINPGAYTHTSIAIRDCLEYIPIKKCEVHLSDIKNREDFRKVDYISPVVDKVFMGHGCDSYIDAVNYIMASLKKEAEI